MKRPHFVFTRPSRVYPVARSITCRAAFVIEVSTSSFMSFVVSGGLKSVLQALRLSSVELAFYPWFLVTLSFLNSYGPTSKSRSASPTFGSCESRGSTKKSRRRHRRQPSLRRPCNRRPRSTACRHRSIDGSGAIAVRGRANHVPPHR